MEFKILLLGVGSKFLVIVLIKKPVFAAACVCQLRRGAWKLLGVLRCFVVQIVGRLCSGVFLLETLQLGNSSDFHQFASVLLLQRQTDERSEFSHRPDSKSVVWVQGFSDPRGFAGVDVRCFFELPSIEQLHSILELVMPGLHSVLPLVPPNLAKKEDDENPG